MFFVKWETLLGESYPAEGIKMKELFVRKFNELSYPKMVAIGYLVIILLGTFLLTLPIASRDGQQVTFLGALYTATSATCVTGLIHMDTYVSWSLFGQLVVLGLIQIGGLGFMTILTMFSFVLRKKIGLKARGLLRDSVNTLYIGGVVRLFRKILLGTLLFEALGALILAFRFVPAFGLSRGIYYSIFHSVSAFCNAGFDLMGIFEPYSSLTHFANDPAVCLTVSALIVIGGIGFFVWDDISTHKHHLRSYQLHTKIVLAVTILLIVLGTAAFYLFENGNTLAGMSLGQKLWVSLFSAISPRTAGFNVVDMAKLTPASKLLTMILMFIGGSPGSTAGGIKTTTFAVLLITFWSSVRNTKGDNVFGRRLEETALRKASAVVVTNTFLALGAAMLICFTNQMIPMEDILFEAISAIGTVGLTTGITGSLNTFAKVLVILLMYSGRVGSLTFTLLFTEQKTPDPLQRPTEKISIG